MSNDFYTKITLEHQYPDDFGPTITTIEKKVWDGDLNMYLNMFHTLMIGETFTEEGWKQGLIDYLRDWYNVQIVENCDDVENVNSL